MNKYLKFVMVFIGVLLLSFILLYTLIEPMVQDAYKKGYDKGKNETCKFIFNSNDEWDNEYATGKKPNFQINFSINIS